MPLCVTDVRNRRLGTQKRENRDGDERIYTYIYIYIYTERGEYADGKSRRRRKGGRGICYKGVVIGSGKQGWRNREAGEERERGGKRGRLRGCAVA